MSINCPECGEKVDALPIHKCRDNDLREQVAKRIYKSDGFNQAEYDADELITLIRTAALDEVKDAFSEWQDGASPLDCEDFNNAIDNLRGRDATHNN